MNSNTNIEPDYGNCGIVRFRGKEAYVKDVSLRTETWYKADGMVKLAQHSEGLSSMSEVIHDLLMNRMRERINDKRVLRLIGKYL